MKYTQSHRSVFYALLILIAYIPIFFYYNLIAKFCSWLPTTISTYLTCIFLLFEFIFAFRCGYFQKYKTVIPLIALMLIFMLGTVIKTNSGKDVLLQLIMVLFTTFLLSSQRLSESETDILYGLFLFVVCLILINADSGEEHQWSIYKFNPNSGGFLCSLAVMCAVAMFFKTRKFIHVLFIVVGFAAQFYFLSRAAFLGCLLFIALFIVGLVIKKNIGGSFMFWTALSLAVFGVILAFIYSILLPRVISRGEIKIFGKDLFTGRDIIWAEIFKSLPSDLLFGLGTHFNGELLNDTGNILVQNAHNQPLGVLAVFGAVTFFLFYCLYAYFASEPCRRFKMKFNYAAFPAAIIVMSYFDVYFFSLYNSLAILVTYAIILNLTIDCNKKDVFYGDCLYADL